MVAAGAGASSTTLVPYRTGDLFRDGDRVSGPAGSAIRSWLAVPIVRNGVGIGLVEVDSTEIDAFGPDDETLLAAVVGVLAGAVEVAAHHDEERRAAALRDAFIGVIGHELRTPVTTIHGLARILRRAGSGIDPETRDQAIVDIEEEADRLARLIEDLLVLSRVEGGRVPIDPEPINLARLVRHIVETERDRHPNHQYRFEEAPDVQLAAGEETYVEQVVRNLLSNAAKYSPTGTPIEIVLARATTASSSGCWTAASGSTRKARPGPSTCSSGRATRLTSPVAPGSGCSCAAS